MLNIADLVAAPYTFKDGDKTITLKNPLEEHMLEARACKDPVAMVNKVLEFAFYDEDKHYLKELDLGVKIKLYADYLEYHRRALEDSFRSSVASLV